MMIRLTKLIRSLSLAACLACFGMTAPASAQLDARQQFPQVSTMSPHGVDLQQGTFAKQGVDLTIGPLSVDHYIRSKIPGPLNGIMAPSAIATSLQGHSNNYQTVGVHIQNIYIGTLRLTFHVHSTSGNFLAFDSANTGWKMVRNGTQFVLTNKSGDIYLFDTHSAIPSLSRLLSKHTSPNGDELTYAYDSTARLINVKSNRGYAVVLQYTSNSVIACGVNLAATVMPSSCSGSTYKVTYGKNSSGQVSSITGLDGSVVTISYGANGPTCVSLPNSSTCAIQNTYGTNVPSLAINVQGQVISQATAAGETWAYGHVGIENNPGDYVPGFGEIRRSFGYMTPPGIGGTTATFGNGFVESIVAPEGTTTYEYAMTDAYAIYVGGFNGNWTGPHYYSVYPQRITYPEGNSIYFTRDYADNVIGRAEVAKPGSGLASNVTAWKYPTPYKWSINWQTGLFDICAGPEVLCDKPTKVTDPNGNVTDFTYDATHGGMLTKTEAAVNGTRPQTRYTYVQRNARDVNGTALTPPVWVLASEEYCKTTAASGSGCAGGASDEVVTTYDYGPTTGPNNLLLRGTVVDPTGLNLRTCYTYDQYGRKISETQPLGTGSSCP